MIRLVSAILLLACHPGVAATNEFEIVGRWSDAVDGVRGRLLFDERATSVKGLREGIVYLQLQSVAVGESIHIYYAVSKFPFRPVLRDAGGNLVQEGLLPSSGMPRPCWLVLPFDSALLLRTGASSTSPTVPGLTVIGARAGGNWFIPGAVTNDYFLSATFTATIPEGESRPRMWEGTLKLPPIKIPKAEE
jgi:hypothetical protein